MYVPEPSLSFENQLSVTNRLNLAIYREVIRTRMMRIYVKPVSGWKGLIHIAKTSILDVWLGSDYASGLLNSFLIYSLKSRKVFSVSCFLVKLHIKKALNTVDIKPNSQRPVSRITRGYKAIHHTLLVNKYD